MVAAMLLLHVTLALPARALPPLTLKSAVAEAAAIWAPYDVTIDAVVACGCPDDRPPVVRVSIALASAPGIDRGWHGPLAAIGFDADGGPIGMLTLYLTEIERQLDAARVFGGELSHRTSALREIVLGRIVGRVIAHEIGHYVLRMPGHAASGLMQPVHRTDRLAAPSRDGFELSPDDVLRLK